MTSTSKKRSPPVLSGSLTAPSSNIFDIGNAMCLQKPNAQNAPLIMRF